MPFPRNQPAVLFNMPNRSNKSLLFPFLHRNHNRPHYRFHLKIQGDQKDKQKNLLKVGKCSFQSSICSLRLVFLINPPLKIIAHRPSSWAPAKVSNEPTKMMAVPGYFSITGTANSPQLSPAITSWSSVCWMKSSSKKKKEQEHGKTTFCWVKS